MPRYPWLPLLQAHRAIAVIRTPRLELAQHLAHALAQGGMRLLEITWNSDRAPELITRLRTQLPHCVIGAGTLLASEQLQQAIAAGAEFLFTPHVDRHLIQLAQQHEIPIVPGAFSPTEIVTAWQAGASSVKVFPIESLGGASYIRNLQGPLAPIPLIPTGGVTVENAKDFLAAGAIAVGLSTNLFPAKVVEAEDWDAIAARARGLMQSLDAIP